MRPRLEGGSKKEARFAGERQIGADVGDQEVVFVRSAGEGDVEQLADVAACAVAAQHIGAAPGFVTLHRFHVQRHPVGILAQADHFMQPRDVNQAGTLDAFQQKRLGVALLQVDEGGQAVGCGRGHRLRE